MAKTFSMSTLDAIEIINSGGCVIDVGQFSAKTRRVLKDYVSKGRFETFDYFGFPKPKTGYCLPDRVNACAGMAA